MSVLSPAFLINNIDVISLIIAGFLLIIFDNIVTRNAFKLADQIKHGTEQNIRSLGQRGGVQRVDYIAKFTSEFIAAAIILLYAYFGTTVLAEYVFSPILFKLKEYLLIWIIIIFLFISWVVNNKHMRRTLMEV